MVSQAQEHVVVAAEQEVWTQPRSAQATAEPSPQIPLLGASALLGHPFWGTLLKKWGLLC